LAQPNTGPPLSASAPGAHWIDVAQRVQAQPVEVARGGIAQHQGHAAVGHLVRHDGHNQARDQDEGAYQGFVHARVDRE
jgi:hypothetical protein